MPRYKLTIEYDGGPYHGWQRQNEFISVQQALEEALRQFTREQVTAFAAGRTDTGVHATGQVVHLDLANEWRAGKIIEATNGILRLHDHPISVIDVDTVDQDFDARFSAKRRYYRYRLINRIAPLAVEHGRAWWVRFPLDVEAMNDAAKLFLGKHDFTTFRSTDCQAKSPVRTVDRFSVTEKPLSEIAGAHGRLIEFDVDSKSFLHSQVRSMVGSLKMVGDGKWSRADLKKALEARDRKACGVVAPPDGLYLMRVDY